MLFIVFAALAVLANIKPTTPKAAINATLFITLNWDISTNADIDLWIKSPGDKPIGYLRKAGLFCNLVRDDQGRKMDPESNNSELIICRGIPAGNWQINVVCFNEWDNKFPVPFKVNVYQLTSAGSIDEINSSGTLVSQDEEITQVTFVTDDKGNITSYNDTINSLIPLWVPSTP